MTVIVAVRKGERAVIAADSAQSDGSLVVPAHFYRDFTKLLRCGECWLGSSGWSATVDALESIIRSHDRELDWSSRRATFESARRIHRLLKDDYFVETQEEKEQPVESSQLDALIVGPAGIFEFESYRSVSEYSRYWAIGSGKTLALGAMHAVYERLSDPMDIAVAGVEAACELDEGCRLPMEHRCVNLC